jgi:hypothetical protein
MSYALSICPLQAKELQSLQMKGKMFFLLRMGWAVTTPCAVVNGSPYCGCWRSSTARSRIQQPSPTTGKIISTESTYHFPTVESCGVNIYLDWHLQASICTVKFQLELYSHGSVVWKPIAELGRYQLLHLPANSCYNQKRKGYILLMDDVHNISPTLYAYLVHLFDVCRMHLQVLWLSKIYTEDGQEISHKAWTVTRVRD